jgi:hypothetical protein
MEQMMKHLEKAYPTILKAPTEMETKHKELCNQIEKIMVSEAPVLLHEPSYQKIITDKIKSYCPSLKWSNDVELRENNIYIDAFIFDKIFHKVSPGEFSLTLTVENKYNNNISQLFYNNAMILGQGEQAVMNKLKEAVEELVNR